MNEQPECAQLFEVRYDSVPGHFLPFKDALGCEYGVHGAPASHRPCYFHSIDFDWVTGVPCTLATYLKKALCARWRTYNIRQAHHLKSTVSRKSLEISGFKSFSIGFFLLLPLVRSAFASFAFYLQPACTPIKRKTWATAMAATKKKWRPS